MMLLLLLLLLLFPLLPLSHSNLNYSSKPIGCLARRRSLQSMQPHRYATYTHVQLNTIEPGKQAKLAPWLLSRSQLYISISSCSVLCQRLSIRLKSYSSPTSSKFPQVVVCCYTNNNDNPRLINASHAVLSASSFSEKNTHENFNIHSEGFLMHLDPLYCFTNT